MRFRKGYLRPLCALILVLAVMTAAAAPVLAVSVSDFSDVSSGSWYYDAVSFAVDNGLFNGTSSSSFTPNGNMTRGMFITVLGRYAGVDPDAWKAAVVTDDVNVRSGPGTSYDVVGAVNNGGSVTLQGRSGDWYKVTAGGQSGYIKADFVRPSYHVFTDVDYGDYYTGYAIWGYEAGIVSGMGTSELFAPERNVTREQICKLLYGYAGYAGIYLSSGSTASFSDQGSISSWAVDGVDAMQATGIIEGENRDGGVYFRPGSNATRAEAATIFRRLSLSSETPQGSTGGSTGTSVSADDIRGDYAPGSVYGQWLADWQLQEVKEQVAYFIRNYYDPNASDFENLKTANDYLVDYLHYELGSDTVDRWTAWAALTTGAANCIGYAFSLRALCDAMGIECIAVSATNRSHTWNMVKVDGNWYHMDTEYNDLVSRYSCFLRNDDMIYGRGIAGWYNYYDQGASLPACPSDYPYPYDLY